MDSRVMHRIGGRLGRAAPTVLAAALAFWLLAAAAPAPAQSLSKPGALETARTTGSGALTPQRRSGADAATALTGSAPGAELKAIQPPVRWVGWAIAAALGAAALLAAGFGIRLARSGVVPAPRSARRAQRSRALARAEAEEFLGAETWVPGMQHRDAAAPTHQRHAMTQPVVLARAAPPSPASSSVPPEFDAPAFARDAKLLFMRFTTAWDARDQAEMQQLVMPEALDRLTRQIEQTCGHWGPVDFLTLEAQVLRVTRSQPEGVQDNADVRFHGLYRAATQTTASPFDCVWSLVNDRGAWRLTAIQVL